MAAKTSLANNRKAFSRLASERGSAMVETVPLLVIFIVLLGFGLGFFGVIQTAIMNSMASRAYAFETFRNRADLTLFRDTGGPPFYQFQSWGSRFHTINDERVPASVQTGQYATSRPITMFPSFASVPSSDSSNLVTVNNSKIYGLAYQNRSVDVSPAWVMVGYGICLNANCGDQ